MTNTNGDESLGLDSVLPGLLHEDAVPTPLDTLQPWHKPRKQYIREQQWKRFSERLVVRIRDRIIQESNIDKPEIHYLTLPGIDYLDVRILSELCADKGCELTSTGFLADRIQNVARAKVRETALIEADHISKSSYTFNHKFEEIRSESSSARKDFERRAPFDIINIDACSSLGSSSDTSSARLVDAIHQVIKTQLNRQHAPWLLFLTNDVRKESLSEDILSKFCEAILDNANNCEEFGACLIAEYGDRSDEIEAVLDKMSQSESETFLKLVSLGFTKWILHLIQDRNWKVKTHSSYCYSTTHYDDNRPSMVCLAFEFIPPTNLNDRHKIVRASEPISDPSESSSMRALRKISEMVDLDRRLEQCPSLKEALVSKTKDLLEEAGYDQHVLSELES